MRQIRKLQEKGSVIHFLPQWTNDSDTILYFSEITSTQCVPLLVDDL